MRLLSLCALITFGLGQVASYNIDIHPEYQEGLSINDVPADRRLHWMRVANEVSRRYQLGLCSYDQAVYASGHPCPQAPFGSAIVNTTSDELICVIANAVGTTGGESKRVV
jgi:hypothetical protein